MAEAREVRVGRVFLLRADERDDAALGEEVEKGELPNDLKWLGGLVSDISFNNANSYFGFNA